MFLSDGGKNNPFDNVSFRGGSDKTSRLGDKQEVFNYTFGSIEDEGGVTRPDPGELQQEVLELAHTNRRLTGENADLTAHLTHAEDTNLSLREQCHHLEHTLSSVQQQLVAARRLEAEMEEVQNQLECEREEKEQLQTRLTYLEKDNLTLTTRLEDLLQQMESDQEDTESQAALQAELVKNHKDEVATLVNELAKWKVEAETHALAAHHLDETAKDLRKLNTALRDEKANLEEQLAHLKEELVSATHSETEISGIDVGEEAEQNNVDSEEVMLSRPHSKGTWGAPSFSTPYCNKSALSSPEDTPLSIHSEIQTMGEYSGSLPFCEKSKNTTSSVVKSEAGVNTVPQPYLSDKSLSSLTSLLNSMLKWWRDWEERGVPLLKGTIEEDTAALHVHFIAHHEELLKLEKELQEIKKQIVIHTPPPSSGRTSVSDGCREGSLSSPRDTQLPSAQHVTPKSKPQKTPGSLVSQLISRFEQSSRSTSPACSELSDRFGFVECNSNLSKMVERSRAGRGSSSSYPDHDCGRSSPSYDGGRSSASSDFGRASPSSEHTSPTFKTMEDHKIQKKNSSESDSCLGSNLVISEESGDEHYCSSDILSAKDCVGETSPTSQEYIDIVLHNSIEQDTDFTYMDTENTVQETSTTVVCDNIEEDNKEEDLPEDTEKFGGILLDCGLETEDLVTKEDNRKEDNRNVENEDHTGSSAHRDDQEKDNGSTTTVEVDIELETDIYMETSHLMKLMNELTLMEDKKESFTAVLTRLYRLTLQVSTDTYK
ncbi:KASH5-like [Homarus americanus]|uniref:KASH5-like n=1 Tax=Homarus americanus TaxID=6706 RepID=A0A8J5JYL1_HOMAM|nr:KASH5-like [Homarus americanus]